MMKCCLLACPPTCFAACLASSTLLFLKSRLVSLCYVVTSWRQRGIPRQTEIQVPSSTAKEGPANLCLSNTSTHTTDGKPSRFSGGGREFGIHSVTLGRLAVLHTSPGCRSDWRCNMTGHTHTHRQTAHIHTYTHSCLSFSLFLP